MTKHMHERMVEREVPPRLVADAINRGRKIRIEDGKIQCILKRINVILSWDGEFITVFKT